MLIRYVLGIEGVHGLAVGMLSKVEVDCNYKLLCENHENLGLWPLMEMTKREIKTIELFCRGCDECVPAYTNHGT